MTRLSLLLVIYLISCADSSAQKRLELIETNVSSKDITPYADSYVWTKSWWLVGNKLPDTLKGGNAITAGSPLTALRVDSVSRVFTGYLSPKLIRTGQWEPRIVFSKIQDTHPYFLSTFYEIRGDSVRLLGQLKILFGPGTHNAMPDIWDIQVFDPERVLHHPSEVITGALKRAATAAENDIAGPPVVGM